MRQLIWRKRGVFDHKNQGVTQKLQIFLVLRVSTFYPPSYLCVPRCVFVVKQVLLPLAQLLCRTLLRVRLLESQQRGRVGPRGATRGQATGERGHNRQNRNYKQVGHRVVGRDAYQYRPERASHGERESQSDHESYREPPHAMKEHESPQAKSARARAGQKFSPQLSPY
jgi:hypothetical protein